METVLREIGVGDISIPKKMRRLAASSAGLLQSYEEALLAGMAGSLPRLLEPCRLMVRLPRLPASGSRIM
jgi:hypothetical protein